MGREDHSKAHDKELGMGCPISRRDFLNGIAIGTAALAYPRASSASEPNRLASNWSRKVSAWKMKSGGAIIKSKVHRG